MNSSFAEIARGLTHRLLIPIEGVSVVQIVIAVREFVGHEIHRIARLDWRVGVIVELHSFLLTVGVRDFQPPIESAAAIGERRCAVRGLHRID